MSELKIIITIIPGNIPIAIANFLIIVRDDFRFRTSIHSLLYYINVLPMSLQESLLFSGRAALFYFISSQTDISPRAGNFVSQCGDAR